MIANQIRRVERRGGLCIIEDNFNDTPLTAMAAHPPDQGGPWEILSGSWRIAASGTQCEAQTANTQMVYECSQSDMYVEIVCAQVNMGQIVRAVDSDNMLHCYSDADNAYLYKRVAGVDTYLNIAVAAGTPGSPFTVKMQMIGDELKIQHNGGAINTSTQAGYAGTKGGLRRGAGGSLFNYALVKQSDGTDL